MNRIQQIFQLIFKIENLVYLYSHFFIKYKINNFTTRPGQSRKKKELPSSNPKKNQSPVINVRITSISKISIDKSEINTSDEGIN